MKKTIFIFLLALILSAGPVFAEKTTSNAQGQGEKKSNEKVEKEVINNTEEVLEEEQNQEQEQVQNQEQEMGATRARNTNQLREMIQLRKSELTDELDDIKEEVQQKVYRNQNVVREAVHTLLAAEDLVGGVGQQVSEIAQEFNNSVQKTIGAEEKIQKRSGFVKFLIGGVKNVAQELKQEAQKNKERIQELKELKEQNWMQTEVKEILQEQIQNLEQEQNRLQNLAEKEINKKGIFGWLINLFK
ncbi:hypothetical protein L6278_02130 [Candidatus Parcubacteria bacterium]|nr:hypothetical protein [Candidatus Parcubacteria bacterium]